MGKKVISEIFHDNRGRYRRICLELRNKDIILNHKTFLKLMNETGLKCRVIMKKYRSYKGDVSRVVPNLFERNFKANKPNQKWVTDVTEFSVFGTKYYLSTIMDLYNREIISYNVTYRQTLDLVINMIDFAFDRIQDNIELANHSAQDSHYQHKNYRSKLKDKGIIQSMSRKGYCLVNAAI